VPAYYGPFPPVGSASWSGIALPSFLDATPRGWPFGLQWRSIGRVPRRGGARFTTLIAACNWPGAVSAQRARCSLTEARRSCEISEVACPLFCGHPMAPHRFALVVSAALFCPLSVAPSPQRPTPRSAGASGQRSTCPDFRWRQTGLNTNRDLHVLPVIGAMPSSTVKPADIREVLASAVARGLSK
jgi:hypothetical protein